MTPRVDADLVVAGGGPAGLATAIHAARAGLRVVVCEPRPGPIDKACGEGIMPGGLARLAALGVDPAGVEFAGIAYSDQAGRRAEARFAAGPGRGVRRTELQACLAAASEAAGVRHHRARVDDVRQDRQTVTAAGLTARWLVAADGLHSSLRRRLGVAAAPGTPRRVGLRRHWRCPPWSDMVEVLWGPRCEAYLTPVAGDQVGVALLYDAGRQTRGADLYHRLLRDFPDLRRRLTGAEPISAVRGAGPLRQSSTARVCGRVLLVGDAAGYVDALTGEGISMAVAQAEAAVAAIVAADPGRYEHSWRQITRGYRLLTGGLVRATTPAAGRRLVVPVCARAPAVFARIVNSLAADSGRSRAPLRPARPP